MCKLIRDLLLFFKCTGLIEHYKSVSELKYGLQRACKPCPLSAWLNWGGMIEIYIAVQQKQTFQTIQRVQYVICAV